MKQSIDLSSYPPGDTFSEDVELSPTCPQCGVSLLPVVLHGVEVSDDSGMPDKVFLLNYCPSCKECFISRHVPDIMPNDGYSFDSAAPKHAQTVDWGQIIDNVSPTFVEIYNQSVTAEATNLDQIAGVGYRKALEFLIKDYLISLTQDSDKITAIKNKFLGKCINEDIDNPQLKIVASRAAWLGNDQTHYEQRFDDRDISDLKRMIRLTVHWISLIKETEEAELIQPR